MTYKEKDEATSWIAWWSAIIGSAFFALWQWSLAAGVFMFTVFLFAIACMVIFQNEIERTFRRKDGDS